MTTATGPASCRTCKIANIYGPPSCTGDDCPRPRRVPAAVQYSPLTVPVLLAADVAPMDAAAAAYREARSDFWNEVTEPARMQEYGVPDWDAPEVEEARAVMETAAAAYRAQGGNICEDCGELERCVCPNV